MQFSQNFPSVANGIRYLNFTSQSPSQRMMWRHAVMLHGGMLYQIFVFAQTSNISDVNMLCQKSLDNFHLIDPTRTSPPPQTLFGDRKPAGSASPRIATHRFEYTSKQYGIATRVRRPGAEVWDAAVLQFQFPTAAWGALFAEDHGLVIIPVDLGDASVDDEVLWKALLTTAGIDYPNEARELSRFQQGGVHGERMTVIAEDDDGVSYTYRIRVSRHSNIGVAVLGFGRSTVRNIRSTLDSGINGVSLQTPLPQAQRWLGQAEATRRDADVLNQIGLQFYARSEYDRALELFQAAQKVDPAKDVYSHNIFEALVEAGRNDEAVAAISRILRSDPTNVDLQIRKAGLLVRMDKAEQAASIFHWLDQQNSLTDETIPDYLNLLVELDRSKKAVHVIESYIKRQPSPSIGMRRWQFRMYQAADEDDRAIAVATQLADDHPNNRELGLDLVSALVGAERGDDAIKRLDGMSESAAGSLRGLYLRGQAQLANSDYAQAKQTFETALKLSPGDQRIREALDAASGLLGQGNNSAIKETIEPVEIPRELAAALERAKPGRFPDGYKSRVLRSVTGIRFVEGERIRRTVYRTIQVLTLAGADDFKTVTARFDPSAERIFMNSLEVFDQDGKLIGTGDVSTYYVTSDGDSSMATNNSVLYAPVPGIRPGCTIRYSYTVEQFGRADVFPYERFLFATLEPAGPRAVFVSGNTQALRYAADNGRFASVTAATLWAGCCLRRRVISLKPASRRWRSFCQRCD